MVTTLYFTVGGFRKKINAGACNDEEIRKVFYCPFLLGIQFSGLTGFIYGESNTGALTVTIFSTHLLGHKNKHISLCYVIGGVCRSM